MTSDKSIPRESLAGNGNKNLKIHTSVFTGSLLEREIRRFRNPGFKDNGSFKTDNGLTVNFMSLSFTYLLGYLPNAYFINDLKDVIEVCPW